MVAEEWKESHVNGPDHMYTKPKQQFLLPIYHTMPIGVDQVLRFITVFYLNNFPSGLTDIYTENYIKTWYMLYLHFTCGNL